MIKLTLRIKVLILLIIFALVFLGIIIFISQKMILVSFAELENKEAIKSIQRTKTVFDRQILNTDVKLADWAIWDDSYYFAQDKNQKYIDSNLTDQSLYNLQINAMFFIATSGALIYEKQIDTQTIESIPVSNELRNLLLKSRNIISFKDINDKHSGILRSTTGPVFFASRPILKSDGSGPIAGTLIFIRNYDAQLKDYFEKINNNNKVDILDYESTNLGEEAEAKEQLSADNKYYAYSHSPDTIDGFTLIYDYNNKPVYILENELPRLIYKQGIATVSKYLYFIVVLSVAGVIFVHFLINKFVLSKIIRLNENVDRLKDRNTSVNKLDVKGNDEFANLTANINQLLDYINRSQEDLKKVDEELRTEKENIVQKAEELEKMNKLMIGRELKMVELKKEIERLKSEKSPKND